MIEAGHIYVAQPPLYRVQKGNVSKYAYTESQLEKLRTNLAIELTFKDIKVLGKWMLNSYGKQQ